MIYFDLSSKKNVIEDHYKLLEKELKYKAEGSTLSKKQKKFITDNLESILTKKPSDLLQLETRFKTLGKKKNTNAQLKTIFNYNKFIIKNARKYDAYDLANKLGVRVCLYCNRMYTLTIQTSSKKEDHIIRPEFDHFFNKDKHPLLGLSI